MVLPMALNVVSEMKNISVRGQRLSEVWFIFCQSWCRYLECSENVALCEIFVLGYFYFMPIFA